MIKKAIKYTDYNGVERVEDFYFNLNKAEIIEMELSVEGGYSELLNRIAKSQDIKEIVNVLKTFILKSYGEKSIDGKRFVKVDENGKPLYKKFEETEAFVELYVELTGNVGKAIEFINSIIPNTKTVEEVNN
jgi:hypothetical protein